MEAGYHAATEESGVGSRHGRDAWILALRRLPCHGSALPSVFHVEVALARSKDLSLDRGTNAAMYGVLRAR